MRRSFALAGMIVVLTSATQSVDARSDSASPPLDERVRRGIVLVEHRGAPIAIGTVLGRDGRVLTALSGLAGATEADLRYVDGSLAHARIGRSDKASDLALLVPEHAGSTEGLDASNVEPDRADLRLIVQSGGGRLDPAPVSVHGDVAAHGQAGQPTVRMWNVGLEGPSLAGAPLLDTAGRVVAVLVHACKVIPTFAAAPAPTAGEQLPLPPPPCVPELLGAPVAAIRFFLAAASSPDVPRLGVRGEREEKGSVHGVRVVAVAPASPAERAGMRPDVDVIVAVDGRPVDAPGTLAALVDGHAARTTVKLLVLGDAGYREVFVSLPGGGRSR